MFTGKFEYVKDVFNKNILFLIKNENLRFCLLYLILIVVGMTDRITTI